MMDSNGFSKVAVSEKNYYFHPFPLELVGIFLHSHTTPLFLFSLVIFFSEKSTILRQIGIVCLLLIKLSLTYLQY